MVNENRNKLIGAIIEASKNLPTMKKDTTTSTVNENKRKKTRKCLNKWKKTQEIKSQLTNNIPLTVTGV